MLAMARECLRKNYEKIVNTKHQRMSRMHSVQFNKKQKTRAVLGKFLSNYWEVKDCERECKVRCLFPVQGGTEGNFSVGGKYWRNKKKGSQALLPNSLIYESVDYPACASRASLTI